MNTRAQLLWEDFDKRGEAKVREEIGLRIYGEQMEAAAHQWLAYQESKRTSEAAQAVLAENKAANDLARSANAVALEANEIAREASASASRSAAAARTNNMIATLALIVAVIAIALSTIGLFLKATGVR